MQISIIKIMSFKLEELEFHKEQVNVSYIMWLVIGPSVNWLPN